MRYRAGSRIALALLLFVCHALAPPVRASWLSDATGINIDLNREVGTGLSAMAGPSFERAEETGRRLIGEADAAMKARIDQVDAVAKANIERIDTVMENRLLQADQIAARRLDQVDTILARRITQADEAITNQIANVDSLIGRRLIDVDGLVAGALTDLDDRLTKRISELDEIAERRIGTLDTLATKATLGLEDTVRRLLLAACILIFLTAALWRIYAVSGPLWADVRRSTTKRSFAQDATAFGRRAWKPLLVQVCALFLAVLSIYGAYLLVPGSPAVRADALRSEYEAGFTSSLSALELREARYFAAQLRLLAPGEHSYGALVQKAELVRDVLDRPTIATAAGFRVVESRLRSLETLIGRRDPDLLTVAALLTWQAGSDRRAELGAAVLSAYAIETAEEKSFPLLPIAVAYLQTYLTDPLPAVAISRLELKPRYSAEQLGEFFEQGKALLATQPERVDLTRPTTSYNARVATVLAASKGAYPQIIKAIALRNPAEVRKHAEATVKAWRDFDAELSRDEELSGTPVAFATFGLNDATYTRACWYSLNAATTGSAPSSSWLRTADKAVAAPCAPPRVFWAKRYLSSLSSETALFSTLEEARRFDALDEGLVTMEQAAISFQSELAGENRLQVLLDRGRNAAIHYARHGFDSAALDVLSSLKGNVGTKQEERLDEIELAVAREMVASRRPLV